MDFSQVTDITIPEGDVIQIAQGATVLWEKSGLPSGYVKVEYLESTGTQWINTGYKLWLTTNWKLECKFNFTETQEKSSPLFGITSTTSTYKMFMTSGSSLNMIMPTFASRIISAIQTNTTYVLECSNYLPYFESHLDGVLKNRLNRSETTSGANILLLRDVNATYYQNSKCKLYYVKFWAGDNESLVADLQPCVRLSDGKPGMYDLVRRQFLTNAGTGEFLIGPTTQIPDAYQPVQYLESTGTQYIDTGIEGKNGLDISARFMSADILQTRIMASSDGTKRLGLLASSTTGAIVNQYDTVNKVLSDYVLETTTIHSLSNKNGVLFYDGAQVDTATTATFTTGKNLYLFASNSTTVATAYVKIYGAMILDNGALVRYFVPCYRKSDNVAGMYDIVNDVFYTNSGTGTFTVGPELLPDTYKKVQYLEGTQTQYIDTGITVDQDMGCEISFQYPQPAQTTGSSARVIGTRETSSGATGSFCFISSATGEVRGTMWLATNGVQVASGSRPSLDYNVNTVKANVANDKNLYWNGTLLITGNDTAFTSTSTLSLFRTASLSTPSTPGDVRIYSVTLYDDGAPFRKFIPAVRKSDNEPGMYELMTKTFFTNSGTGDFVVGPDV